MRIYSLGGCLRSNFIHPKSRVLTFAALYVVIDSAMEFLSLSDIDEDDDKNEIPKVFRSLYSSPCYMTLLYCVVKVPADVQQEMYVGIYYIPEGVVESLELLIQIYFVCTTSDI